MYSLLFIYLESVLFPPSIIILLFIHVVWFHRCVFLCVCLFALLRVFYYMDVPQTNTCPNETQISGP